MATGSLFGLLTFLFVFIVVAGMIEGIIFGIAGILPSLQLIIGVQIIAGIMLLFLVVGITVLSDL
jgi:hypothetical protein